MPKWLVRSDPKLNFKLTEGYITVLIAYKFKKDRDEINIEEVYTFI